MSFDPTPEQIAEHDRRNRAMPERSHEATAALAVQLHEHLQGCTICKMPIDIRQWDGVVLCPIIREWLDLHFPESPRNPEVNEARSATTASPAPPEGQTRAESREALTAAAEWEERFGKPTPEGEKP